MGRLRVQEEKEAWIEGGEERGEGEKGGECKRPEGAAALHNQIPRWCSRMRSTLSAVRRKSRGGGWGIPRAREHSEKCTPSFPSLRFARSQGHPSPKSFNRTPRGIPGINRKHLLVSSTGGPREISTGTFQGGRIDWEKFFIRRGLGIFGVFEDFIFSWGRRGVTSRVTKNDVSCKIRGEFFF